MSGPFGSRNSGIYIGDLTITTTTPYYQGGNYVLVAVAVGDGDPEQGAFHVTRSWTGSLLSDGDGSPSNIYPSPNDTTGSATEFTFNDPGTYLIQCTGSSGIANDSPQSASIIIYIAGQPEPVNYGAYQTIEVYPNPEDLNIPSGSVPAFTVRRKIEKNNTVIVHTPIPTGSRGSNTISGGGFLIPEDLSEIQKENVKIIINNLHSKNAFPTPENITE